MRRPASVTPIGKPGMITGATASPDGSSSWSSQRSSGRSRACCRASEFPPDVEVWSRARREGPDGRRRADGRHRADQRRHHRPALVRWVPLEPATLIWVEALDKGDLEEQGAAPRPHRHAQGAVHRRADRGREDRVSATAARAGPTRARSCSPRATARHATTRTWVLDSPGASRASSGIASSRTRTRIPARRCSGPTRRHDHAGRRLDLPDAAPGRRRKATVRSSIGSNLKTLADRAPVPLRRRRATRRSSACSATTRRRC